MLTHVLSVAYVASTPLGFDINNRTQVNKQVERLAALVQPTRRLSFWLCSDRDLARAEAVRPRPGLTIFTDDSRIDSGAAGYAVAWRHGQRRFV
jgi:hypothetical protein